MFLGKRLNTGNVMFIFLWNVFIVKTVSFQNPILPSSRSMGLMKRYRDFSAVLIVMVNGK